MLQARLLEDFKGARTLLVWGDTDSMRVLDHGLKSVINGDDEALVGDDHNPLILRVAAREHSYVATEAGLLRWECTIDTLQRAKGLVGPLLREDGHQYVDARGDAEQVIISAGEYPADFRP